MATAGNAIRKHNARAMKLAWAKYNRTRKGKRFDKSFFQYMLQCAHFELRNGLPALIAHQNEVAQVGKSRPSHVR